MSAPEPVTESVDAVIARARIVIAHDYLTQRGGAERVVLALLEAFPGARLVTSIYEPSTTFDEFADYEVETLWLNRFGFFRKDPRRAMPLLARAFDKHTTEGVDLVIASSSGWAHAIGSAQPRVVYCYNPARWLYQAEDYFHGKPRAVAQLFSTVTRRLRHWDKGHALDSNLYFAISQVVRERIASTYGIDAQLLPPPSNLTPDGPQEPVDGLEPGFVLTVSRARAYKNTVMACEAVQALPEARLVSVGGLPERPGGGDWSPRLVGVRNMSDAQMRWLYASCAGVVAVSREDFGLTPVEGYSFGRPAAVLQAGGYLDSSAPGVATVWVEEPTVAACSRAVQELLSREWDREAIRAHAELFSLRSFQARMRTAVASVLTAPRSLRMVGPSRPGHPSRRASDVARSRGALRTDPADRPSAPP